MYVQYNLQNSYFCHIYNFKSQTMLHTGCSGLCFAYELDIAGSSSPLIMTIKPETKKKKILVSLNLFN